MAGQPLKCRKIANEVLTFDFCWPLTSPHSFLLLTCGLVFAMKTIGVLIGMISLGLAAGPSLSQSAGEIFLVEATGKFVVDEGRTETFDGIAFAISDHLLLTAERAIGRADVFERETRFGWGGVPSRTIKAGGKNMWADPAERHVVLLHNEGTSSLTPFPLSACGMAEDVGGLSYQLQRANGSLVTIEPTRAQAQDGEDGPVTHFTVSGQPAGWVAGKMFGAPVLHDGKVVGLLTDATADGRSLEVTPIADVLDLLPEEVTIDCDPRASTRIRNVERALIAVVDGLAKLQEPYPDTKQILRDMEASIKSEQTSPLMPKVTTMATGVSKIEGSVSDIEKYLRRLDWTAEAKMDSNEPGEFLVTFRYKTQLPGPSPYKELYLCLRVVDPRENNGQPVRDKDNKAIPRFQDLSFYTETKDRAEEQDLVSHEMLIVCLPAGDQGQGGVSNQGVRDAGEYRFKFNLDSQSSIFKKFTLSTAVPDRRLWTGLIYAALVSAESNDSSESDDSAEQDEWLDPVIWRALIRVDPKLVAPIQCRLFNKEDDVISFLIARRVPTPDKDEFKNLFELNGNSESGSSECVLASAQ